MAKSDNLKSSEEEIISAVIKCVNFASIKHRNQRRKDPDKSPYINHPVGVAHILTEEAHVYDLNVIQAALLHDTVEDTDTSFEEIEQLFGTDVKRIVEEVTDDKSAPKLARKQAQIDHAPKASTQAKLVKLADKLYNLRDLEKCTPEGWTEERVQEYYEWAQKVVAGLTGTNSVLEEQLQKLFEKKGIKTEGASVLARPK